MIRIYHVLPIAPCSGLVQRKAPPPNLLRIGELLKFHSPLLQKKVVSIMLSAIFRAAHQLSVENTSRNEQVPVVKGAVPEAGAGGDATRERMERLEEQLASLTRLVQTHVNPQTTSSTTSSSSTTPTSSSSNNQRTLPFSGIDS